MSKSPICMDEAVIIVTNGGPHPADRWAALSGGQVANLISIDENSNSRQAADGRKNKPKFAIKCSDALEAIFSTAMSDAVTQVQNGTVTQRNAPINVSSYINSVESAIISSAGGTPFAGQFSSQAARSAVGRIVGQYLADAINISRSWALDAKGL